MTSFRRIAGAFLAPASLIVLVSCGGGGGSNSPPSPVPPPPPPPPPVTQTITFANAGPVAKTYGDAAFTNAASGGAGGGAITYSSNALGVATVNAATGEVTIVAAGTAVITANKAADAAYLAASANYTLQVATAAQSISFANAGPVARTFGDAPFGNPASGGAGTGAISYSSGNLSVAAVDASTGQVTIVAAGTATITANKTADGRFSAASANYTVQVAPAAQIISFSNAGPIAKVFGDTAFSNLAAGGAGAGTVSYASNDPTIATVEAATGIVTIVTAGSTQIRATKAADANHLAAQAAYTLNIAQRPQSVSFADPGPIARIFGDAAFTNPAVAIGGSGALSFVTSNPGVASIDASSGLVTIVGAGNADITATKAGDANHAPAQARYNITVARAPQTLGFAEAGPLSRTFGDTAFSNLATGGAGTGAVSYSSSDPGIATVEADTGIVTIVTAGSAQIRASKAADANYLAAQAAYTLDIAQRSQSVSFADPGPIARVYGDAAFTNPAVVIGGSGALTFATSNPGVASVNATSGLVTIVAAGNADITATKAGDANHSSAQTSYGITVARAPQTLSFANAGPIDKLSGDAAFANVASGGGGSGAVTYSSSDPLVAAVNAAGLVTVGAIGNATITASKAASANHLAAQASYAVNVLSRPPEPFTAWLSHNDAAPVTLPAAAVGKSFVRALSADCPNPLSTSCAPVTSGTVTTTSVIDPLAGLGRTSQYWLQNGTAVGRPVTVDARRFREVSAPPFELNGQLWMIADDGTQVWSSSDGRAWSQRSASLPWTGRWGASLVKFNNRLYFIGGRTPRMNETFNDVWTSDDGLNWTRLVEHAPFAVREDAEVIVHDGRLWLIGGYNINGDLRYNDVWSSIDGVDWTQATANAAFEPRHYHRVVEMNGRMWLVGGAGTQFDRTTFGDVWSSADGVAWRSEPAPPFGARQQVATLVQGNRWYVVGGYNAGQFFGQSWWTEDGMQWHQEIPQGSDTFGGRTAAYLIPYRGRVWILGGFGRPSATNMVWSTADFRDWRFENTSVPFSQAQPGRLVSFDGKLWMISDATHGQPMNIWWSVDGNEWTRSRGDWAIAPRTGFTVAVNNGRLWIQGGYRGQDPDDRFNDVWSTADGDTWTQATENAPFEPRYEHEMFAMNGKLFMVGGTVPGVGLRGDVWSSTNGADWIQETPMAAFAERWGHTIVVFNGKAWLLGGLAESLGTSGTSGTTGTIWSSLDGVNWQLEGTDLPATGRHRHRAVVHGGRIWITGGEMAAGPYVPTNHTWYSSDGVTWTQQLTGSPGYTPRQRHGFASHDGKLWIHGGESVAGPSVLNDLFWSIEGTDWRYRYHNLIEIP